MDKARKKIIRSWMMYDWANSAFATTIMAAVLPFFYSSVAGSTLDPTIATSVAEVSKPLVKPIELGELPPIGPMTMAPSDNSDIDSSIPPIGAMKNPEPAPSTHGEDVLSIPPAGRMKLAEPLAPLPEGGQ